MASKAILSLTSRHPLLVAQAHQRHARCMGTLAFQYLQSQTNHESNTAWSQSMSYASPESDFVESSHYNTTASPETALGNVHTAEYLSFAAPESDFSARLVPEAVENHAQMILHPETALGAVHYGENVSFASPEADFTAEKVPQAVCSYQEPEVTTSGPLHSADLYFFASPESDFTAERVSEAVNRPSIDPEEHMDTEFLVASYDSAFGSIHAAEVMSEEMKADILTARGVDYSLPQSVVYQDFVNTMALMASPESAAGFVSSAEYLDEESRSVLYKIQHQEEELPMTLQEAMADPRAIVVTQVDRPFSIVDVNDAWVGLCGYDREEAIHKNLGKLLQGPETDHQVAETIVPQLMRNHFANVELTNYTKEGRRFRNRLRAGLISDDQGVKYFVGVLEEMYESQGGRYVSSATA